MEETREFAVVNFYLWLGKFNTKRLRKKAKLKSLASKVELDAIAKIYFNDLKECKYLLGAGAAALFFLIEAYNIDLSNAKSDSNAILLPFLVSFLCAAVGYRNSYKMDELLFSLKDLDKPDVRNDEQEQELAELWDTVFGRNYVISKAITVSAFAFIIGVITIALTVLRPSLLEIF